MEKTTFDLFVGTYGEAEEETIHWLTFNNVTGSLSEKAAVKGIVNPSFVTVDPTNKFVYAVSEVDAGEIVSYQINEAEQTLTELNRQETKGGPCFVEVTPDNEFALTANFGGGSVIVHPLNTDGTLKEASDYLHYASLAEQLQVASSNVHAIRHIPNTALYIATDLGLNRLFIYQLTSDGKLEEINHVDLPEGSGPRHIDFHPNKQVFYIINEHNSTICTYSYDADGKTVELIQVITTVPSDFAGTNYCADIHITPSGKYVYGSNRGHHSITAFKVLADGTLQEISNHLLKGEWPRNFAIVPNEQFVLVANEHSDTIEIYEISVNGSLIATNEQFSVKKPVCLSFTNVDK